MPESLGEFILRLQQHRRECKPGDASILETHVQELLRSDQDGDADTAVKNLILLCRHFDDRGNWAWMLETCMQGMAVARKSSEGCAEAEFCSWRGLALIMQRSVEEGLQVCREGLDLAEKAQSKRVQGLAHHFLGIGLSSKFEKFAEAMGHFQSAVEAFQHLGDEKEEAAVYFSKAWTLRSFGDFDQALALVTQALSMDSPSDAFRITSLGFKADLEAMNGQLKEAQEHYQETAELCRARDDSYHLSAALTSLGKVCVKQNNLHEAKEHLKEALHLAKLGKRRSGGIADIMRSLAALDCLRSEKEEMLRWYEDAWELVRAEEAAGRPGSGRKQALLRDMGLAHEWLGDSDDALTKLKEAEEVFEARANW